MTGITQKCSWTKGLFGRVRSTVLAVMTAMLISVAVDRAYAAGDHACDYLGKDEVAAVMGAGVGEIERQPANPMGQSVCFFDIPAGMQMRFAQLQMVRSAWATRAGTKWDARSLFENNMSFLSDLQEISGVGNKAYWGGSGLKMGAGLHVLNGVTCFTIHAATGDQQGDLHKAKELAALVLARIE